MVSNFIYIYIDATCFILIYFDRGDTKSPFCQKEANDARLDLRIVAHHTRTVPDLCISEYAKKATPCKYYYDKLKTVVASYIHLREHIKHANLNFEEAKKFILPFVICEGLEADIYTIQVVSEDWCVVEKYETWIFRLVLKMLKMVALLFILKT